MHHLLFIAKQQNIHYHLPLKIAYLYKDVPYWKFLVLQCILTLVLNETKNINLKYISPTFPYFVKRNNCIRLIEDAEEIKKNLFKQQSCKKVKEPFELIFVGKEIFRNKRECFEKYHKTFANKCVTFAN